MRIFWREKPEIVTRLWEEELWEQDEVPLDYTDDVAVKSMKQHCRASSMWAMLPLDGLPGTSKCIVKGNWGRKEGTLNLAKFLNDKNALQQIIDVLTETMRK